MTSYRDIDDQLRDVRVPPDLLARLKQQTGGETQSSAAQPDSAPHDAAPPRYSDEWIERRLADVPVPEGMAARLKRIPADESVDEELRRVSLPDGLHRRLRAIACEELRRPLARTSWRQAAVAASLIVAVGIGYAAIVTGLLMSVAPPVADRAKDVFVGPAASYPEQFRSPRIVIGDAPPASGGAETAGDAARHDGPQHVQDDATQALALDEIWRRLESLWPVGEPPTLRRIIDESPRSAPPRILAEPDRTGDELPELSRVVEPDEPRVGLSMERPIDRRFLLTKKTNPLMTSALGTSWNHAPLPVVTQTDSLETAERALVGGRRPEAETVIVEQFLAATGDAFHRPTEGELGLRTAAGPSPFGRSRHELLRDAERMKAGDVRRIAPQLLQVCLQAPASRRTSPGPVEVTVLLDSSASMKNARRLESAKAAVLAMFPRLGPADRLTLISYDETTRVVFRRLSAGDHDRAADLLKTVTPQGATNLAVALNAAVEKITPDEGADPAARQHLILVCDGLPGISDAAAKQMHSWAAWSQQRGLPTSVIDVSHHRGDQSVLADLANAGGGRYLPAFGRTELTEALLHPIYGRPEVVAGEVQLEVRFNPKAVVAYRRIGCDFTTEALWQSPDVGQSMRAGESSSGLFELWLHPDASEEVGTATARWIDPADGKEKQIAQRLSRVQFAPTWNQSPLPLQAAALVAETAEVLRGSPYAASSRGRLDHVVEQLDRVNPRLWRSSTFERLEKLIRAANATR